MNRLTFTEINNFELANRFREYIMNLYDINQIDLTVTDFNRYLLVEYNTTLQPDVKKSAYHYIDFNTEEDLLTFKLKF